MTSKEEICNMALSRLGASTITSLTDGTTEAKLCNTYFDNLAERATVQGSWTTATFRTQIARTATTPTFGFTYEYQLPVDPKCLKVLGISENKPGTTAFRVEGDKLLTDATTVKIKYIGRLSDTESYGPLLTEAIEALLGSYLAIPLTGKKTIAKELREEYAILIQNNLAIDGQQGSKNVISSPTLTEVRF